MSLLHLSSTLLDGRGFPEVDRPTLRMELTELVDRSWQLLEQLVESTARVDVGEQLSTTPLFLKGQILDGTRGGPAGDEFERTRATKPTVGMLTDVRAEAGHGKQGMMLEETAAGWIAC